MVSTRSNGTTKQQFSFLFLLLLGVCVCGGDANTVPSTKPTTKNLRLSCYSLSRLLIPHNNTNCHTLSHSFLFVCLLPCCPNKAHPQSGRREKEEKKKENGKERETDQMSAEPFLCYCGCGGHLTHCCSAAALSQSLLSFLPCDLMITIFSLIPLQPLNLIIKERNKTKRTQSKNKNKK